MFLTGSIAVAAAKVTGIIASSYGAYHLYATMPETKTRRDLINAFKWGGLCLKVTHGKGKNKKEVVLYPKVQRVSASAEVRTVVFTVPTGLNPQEIYNHDWLLQQAFGEHIEVSGDVKTFTLHIYNGPIDQYKYNFDEIKEFIDKESEKEYIHLPIFVGKSRSGFQVYDMAVHPHLLEAGETGSGKSVSLRSIITTLLLMRRDTIEVYCGDLKRSEFHVFRGVVEKVCIRKSEVHGMLSKIRGYMQKRGDLCDENGVDNVLDLPKAIRPKLIIVAIDEVALLQGDPCMEIIEEISAIGRALGVFLILAMQRPDKDVLDGKLKNNMTVRMAFRHADEINSRITIGTGEAAYIKQSEKGLMIHKLDGIRRVQSPLLKTDACRALLERLKEPADTNEPDKKEPLKKPAAAFRGEKEKEPNAEDLQDKYETALQEAQAAADDGWEPIEAQEEDEE